MDCKDKLDEEESKYEKLILLRQVLCINCIVTSSNQIVKAEVGANTAEDLAKTSPILHREGVCQ